MVLPRPVLNMMSKTLSSTRQLFPKNHYRRWLAPAPYGKRDLARDIVAKALARQD
jgi:hypothetical protein